MISGCVLPIIRKLIVEYNTIYLFITPFIVLAHLFLALSHAVDYIFHVLTEVENLGSMCIYYKNVKYIILTAS